MWIMLWEIKRVSTGPELNCSHRTRWICSMFVSVWQKKPSLHAKRVITRFRSKSNQLNGPFTSGAEHSEKLSDTEHITFGIGAFTKIVPDQLDHMLTERPPIRFSKHSDNWSGIVLPFLQCNWWPAGYRGTPKIFWYILEKFYQWPVF